MDSASRRSYETAKEAFWGIIFTGIDRLLKAGANVNAADDHGVTPLAQACENVSVEAPFVPFATETW